MGLRPKSAANSRASIAQKSQRKSVNQAPDSRQSNLKAIRSPKEAVTAKTVISPNKVNYASNSNIKKHKSPAQEVTMSTDFGSKM